jgi:hypothetical protein
LKSTGFRVSQASMIGPGVFTLGADIMRCSECTADNALDRRFCAGCAARLVVGCPACRFENEPSAKFCGGCAARLTPTAIQVSPERHTPKPLAERILRSRGALEGERKLSLLCEQLQPVPRAVTPSSFRSKEKWCEAEVPRTAGEVALKSLAPDTDKAAKYFDRALAVARQQQAKSWELRASMSLARLWRDQGKVGEARELLAPVYGWFTEGFDTRDLQEAKALLDELAA